MLRNGRICSIEHINGLLDHGLLLGLADDDHPQYLLVDGTRAMSGNLDMGSQDIINLANITLEAGALLTFRDASTFTIQDHSLNAFLSFNGGTEEIIFGQNWTAAGVTCADLGTVTTATSITSTALLVTTASLDTITTINTIDATGMTTNEGVQIVDTVTNAFKIFSATEDLMSFDTTATPAVRMLQDVLFDSTDILGLVNLTMTGNIATPANLTMTGDIATPVNIDLSGVLEFTTGGTIDTTGGAHVWKLPASNSAAFNYTDGDGGNILLIIDTSGNQTIWDYQHFSIRNRNTADAAGGDFVSIQNMIGGTGDESAILFKSTSNTSKVLGHKGGMIFRDSGGATPYAGDLYIGVDPANNSYNMKYTDCQIICAQDGAGGAELHLCAISTDKMGFFGTAPVVRQAAYTQTYNTTSRTHAARTAPAGGAGSGADGTTFSGAECDALVADQQDTAQVLNQLIDDLQLHGLLQ